ncbi:hypothetical protein [Bradyrhizobium sp. RT10b]|uniref:hypothetical protein n=1 Tax=Bradyrhizobium sp. RT10b TaxID=3156331 RepID=UPI0033924E06
MFPPDIVQHVCDPRTGLPGKMKWMPSVAEVKEACEARSAEKARHKRFENWGKNDDDAEERERMKDQGRLPPPPPEKRPTLAALQEKYGPNWGLGGRLPANEEFQRVASLEPLSRDQQFIAEICAQGAARRRGEPGVALRGAARPIGGFVEVNEAAPIVIDGVTLDQGADF